MSYSPPGPAPLTERPWFIVLLIVVFFPVGLFLLWRHPRWSMGAKAAGTAVWAVIVLIGMNSKGDPAPAAAPSAGSNTASSRPAAAPASKPRPAPDPAPASSKDVSADRFAAVAKVFTDQGATVEPQDPQYPNTMRIILPSSVATSLTPVQAREMAGLAHSRLGDYATVYIKTPGGQTLAKASVLGIK